MHFRGRTSRAFSLIEVLISLLIISILVGLLVPTLIYARDAARATVCASNLRQLGGAWQLYISNYEQFPHTNPNLRPEWNYGGATFRGLERRPILAADRPINYELADELEFGNEQLALLYRCPADRGIAPRGAGFRAASTLPGSAKCFDYYGNSYRANRYLLDASLLNPESRPRPLRISEVQVSASRLLLIGDPEWFFATREPNTPESRESAEWHSTPRAGNFLALDGSVRFTRFSPGDNEVAILPRPDLRVD